MARQRRIQADGLSYHITARGTGRMRIFLDTIDRRRFLALLGAVVALHELECHAYCLMTTHYHLVVTTTRANLSRAMQHLNGRYAERWNRRHDRVGHVFQGRFGAQLVQDGAYFLTACRYVALNPVRAGLVDAPERWPWSSFRATVGLAAPPRFLRRDGLLAHFGASADEAAARYRDYVRADPGDEAAFPRDRILGDDVFVREVARNPVLTAEVPIAERLVGHPLRAIFAGALTRQARADAIARAYRLGHHQVDIARALGVHYSTVSKILRDADGGDRA